MSRNGSGVYSPIPNTLPHPTDLGDADKIFSALTDLGNEITASLPRNGSAGMTANLPMGGYKTTGNGTPTDAADGATKGYVDTLDAAQTAALTAGLATKAASSHTHVINDITNSGTVGKLSMAAANQADGRSAIGATADNILPSQTGNSGKALTTNGTTASWGTPLPRIHAGADVKGNVAGAAQIQGTPTNIASVTRVSTGVYDVVFTTNAPNTNYWIGLSLSNNSVLDTISWENRAVSGFRVSTYGFVSGAISNIDFDFNIIVISNA